jgi:transposase-like protein
MSKTEARSFSRGFKLDVVRRMEAGENIAALSREVEVKREVLYRWRDAFRLGGEAALRLKGRPTKAEAAVMRLARGVAGRSISRSAANPIISRSTSASGLFSTSARRSIIGSVIFGSSVQV